MKISKKTSKKLILSFFLFSLFSDAQVRIAELLGVAGTDVPIREVEKLTPPDQVSGVPGPEGSTLTL